MDFSNKPVWVIVGVPVLAIAAYSFGILGETDQQTFNRLQVGMSAAEVRDIVFPPQTGKYSHMPRMTVGSNDNIRINNCFELTMRDGILIEKQWIDAKGR